MPILSAKTKPNPNPKTKPKPIIYRKYIVKTYCKACKNIFTIEKTSEKCFSIRLCPECKNKE